MPTFEVRYSDGRTLRVLSPTKAGARAHADQRMVRWNDAIGPRGPTLKTFPLSGTIVRVTKVKA